MKRFFIKFSYMGTRYRGLQKDNSMPQVFDSDSVQGAIECALTAIKTPLQSKPHFVVSSRTDIGVHGLQNAGHTDLDTSHNIHSKQLLLQANTYFKYCRHDIRFQEVIPVSENFHCRADARSRTYVYRFMRSKDPTITHVPYLDSLFHYKLKSPDLCIERAQSAAALFRGLHDFRTFCAEELPHYKKSLRVLEVSDIIESQSLTPYDPLTEGHEYWAIKFKSKGFLYNQIRRMTAAIMSCAAGKHTENDIKIMLQVPGRQQWPSNIQPLPSHGLQLVNVEYDPEVIERHRLEEEEFGTDSVANRN